MSGIEANRQLITNFYEAFANKNTEAMAECYAEHIVFEDPAFGRLNGPEVMAMWTMLIQRGGDTLTTKFTIREVTNGGAKTTFEPSYLFGPKKRKVDNVISTHFIIEEGKIVYHGDQFNLWKWSRMALGTTGLMIGWSGGFKKKLQAKLRSTLEKFMSKS